MSSETVFLLPTPSLASQATTFASALGNINLFNFSKEAKEGWVPVVANMLVEGGEALSTANVETLSTTGKAFNNLAVDHFSEGIEGAYKVNSKIDSSAVTSFNALADETFTFGFSADFTDFHSQVTDNTVNYSQTELTTAFLVYDTTDASHSVLLDYFFIYGLLIPSEDIGKIKLEASDGISFTDYGGFATAEDNSSFGNASALGTYERTFSENKQLSIVALDLSSHYLMGEHLIGNLGDDVIYGSIYNDSALKGTFGHDKIYASLGHDNVRGYAGHDVMEGGGGNDKLVGNWGYDAIHGGKGLDVINGGGNSDVMAGGTNEDHFIIGNDSLKRKDVDIVEDFEKDTDKIVIGTRELRAGGGDGTGASNGDGLVFSWFEALIADNRLIDTEYGVRIDLFKGGYLLLLGIEASDLDANDFLAATRANLQRLDLHQNHNHTNDTADPIADGGNILEDIIDTVDLTSNVSTLVVDNVAVGENTFTDVSGSGLTVEDRFSTVNTSIDAATDSGGGSAPAPELVPKMLSGSGGDDELNGHAGTNIIDGRYGDDLVAAGGGIDVVYGKGGDDTVSGGSGDDFMFGGSGQDNLSGNSGDDVISGNADSDTIVGGDGDDTLDGGGGGDELQGNAGNDVLIGGTGWDFLLGGAGDDVLQGDNGKDTLTGNGGMDTFVLAEGNGFDTITDFADGTDKLGLVDLDFADLRVVSAGMSAAIEVIATDTRLAILSDVTVADIGAADFIVL